MKSFAYWRAPDVAGAVLTASTQPGATFIAGGTEVLALWRAGACAPELVIDITRLPLGIIEARSGGVRIGALARMSDVADHPLIRNEYPAVAEALLASASPQLRNVATIGGNLLQRTRCGYFRTGTLACNKRWPGSGCDALEGENRLHAVLGTSAQCAATHPSDLAVALIALDAQLTLCGPGGERTLLLDDFYLLPANQPARETALAPGELIIAVEIPATRWPRYSRYVKVRDRASLAFAVVSVAAALQVEDGLIRTARLAAGGVGTKPWRLHGCEAELIGSPVEARALARAAARATEGARPLSRNGFKLELLERTVMRVVGDLVGEVSGGRR